MDTKPVIQVGAKVIITSGQDRAIGYVERETKTQWILATGDRYRKNDLRKLGEVGTWYPSRICAASDEEIAEVRRARIMREFRDAIRAQVWDKVPDSVICDIHAMLIPWKG